MIHNTMDENGEKCSNKNQLPLCAFAGHPLCRDDLKGPKKSTLWTLFSASHAAFFLLFFRWFERPPFTAWDASLGSSSSPLVRGCLGA